MSFLFSNVKKNGFPNIEELEKQLSDFAALGEYRSNPHYENCKLLFENGVTSQLINEIYTKKTLDATNAKINQRRQSGLPGEHIFEVDVQSRETTKQLRIKYIMAPITKILDNEHYTYPVAIISKIYLLNSPDLIIYESGNFKENGIIDKSREKPFNAELQKERVLAVQSQLEKAEKWEPFILSTEKEIENQREALHKVQQQQNILVTNTHQVARKQNSLEIEIMDQPDTLGIEVGIDVRDQLDRLDEALHKVKVQQNTLEMNRLKEMEQRNKLGKKVTDLLEEAFEMGKNTGEAIDYVLQKLGDESPSNLPESTLDMLIRLAKKDLKLEEELTKFQSCINSLPNFQHSNPS